MAQALSCYTMNNAYRIGIEKTGIVFCSKFVKAGFQNTGIGHRFSIDFIISIQLHRESALQLFLSALPCSPRGN